MGLFDFLKKDEPPAEQYFTASLNAKRQPLARGSRFEDPLNEALVADGLGEVTGGGTMMEKTGEILFSDIEIKVNDSSWETERKIIETLERLGAPKGSTLRNELSGSSTEFGTKEGLAVYLNGVDLDEAIYKTTDVDFVCAEFLRLLGDEGNLVNFWQGPRETALYMYGNSFEEMSSRLAGFIQEYPLCSQSRVVRIA